MLENMGLKVIAERPYELEFAGGRRAWIQDLELVMQARAGDHSSKRSTREIKSAFTAVWTGRMDSDGFNQLTLTAGVPWRMVTVLRAYCRYLLQTGLPFSQGYIAQVLVEQRRRSRALLADLFAARFDPRLSPRRARSARWPGSTRGSAAALEEVTRSDEDRILRALWNALSATVRTNAYQPDAGGPAQGLPVLQDRKPEAARAAAAEAAVRDLRVLARAWRACTCAWGTWRAAASAGRTGARISAPRSSG